MIFLINSGLIFFYHFTLCRPILSTKFEFSICFDNFIINLNKGNSSILLLNSHISINILTNSIREKHINLMIKITEQQKPRYAKIQTPTYFMASNTSRLMLKSYQTPKMS